CRTCPFVGAGAGPSVFFRIGAAVGARAGWSAAMDPLTACKSQPAARSHAGDRGTGQPPFTGPAGLQPGSGIGQGAGKAPGLGMVPGAGAAGSGRAEPEKPWPQCTAAGSQGPLPLRGTGLRKAGAGC